jgi:hypothetical protein
MHCSGPNQEVANLVVYLARHPARLLTNATVALDVAAFPL